MRVETKIGPKRGQKGLTMFVYNPPNSKKRKQKSIYPNNGFKINISGATMKLMVYLILFFIDHIKLGTTKS